MVLVMEVDKVANMVAEIPYENFSNMNGDYLYLKMEMMLASNRGGGH